MILSSDPPDAALTEPALLSIDAVDKAFGGVQALSDVSFSVHGGTVMGLIGPNGAGKTTLFNLISGVYPPSRGELRFEGRSIAGRKVHQIVAGGITRTFQNVELFESMTVLENVKVGAHVRTRAGFWSATLRPPSARKEERAVTETARSLLEFVGLSEHAGTPSSELPFGWQRLLEIARALASDPKLLLLDEPAAGLNAVETRQLGELIRKIRDRGVTILLVEHDMSLTMDVCDRIVVLDQGRKIAEGTPHEVQADSAVMAAYLGTAAG